MTTTDRTGDDRVALIIGGGGGIGETTGHLMQARGWRVAIADRDGAAAMRVVSALGGCGLTMDIAVEAEVERGAVEIEEKLICPLRSGPSVNLDSTSKETDKGQEARA